MKEQKSVLAKLLPLDTEITDDDCHTTTIWDLIQTVDRPNNIWTYYLTNVIEMEKPDTSFFIESIWENMDENHGYRFDKFEDCLDPLNSAIQAVFNNWRESLTCENKVFAMDTVVDFTWFHGYIEE